MSEENRETIISEAMNNEDGSNEPEVEKTEENAPEETTSDDNEEKKKEDKESSEEQKDDDDSDKEVQEFDPESLDIPKEWKDTEDFKEFVEIAKETKLDKNTAERLVKWYQDRQTAQWNEFQKTVNDWAKKANQMLGPDAQEALSNVGLAIKRFLSPEEETELRNLFDSTGVGNHPVLVKLMVELSKRAVGGGFAQGEPVATKRKSSPVEFFYGKKE